MFVQRVRELFPRLPVTETHPKALLVAMGMTDGEAFRSHFSIQQDGAEGSEHERDALYRLSPHARASKTGGPGI